MKHYLQVITGRIVVLAGLCMTAICSLFAEDSLLSREEKVYYYDCFDIWKQLQYMPLLPNYPLLLAGKKVKRVTIKRYPADEYIADDPHASLTVVELDREGRVVQFYHRFGSHEEEKFYEYISDRTGTIIQRRTYQKMTVRDAGREYADTLLSEQKSYYYDNGNVVQVDSDFEEFASLDCPSLDYMYENGRLRTIILTYKQNKEKITLNSALQVATWDIAERYLWGLWTGDYILQFCCRYDEGGLLQYKGENGNELAMIFFNEKLASGIIWHYLYDDAHKLVQMNASWADDICIAEECQCARPANRETFHMYTLEYNDRGLPQKQQGYGPSVRSYIYEYEYYE